MLGETEVLVGRRLVQTQCIGLVQRITGPNSASFSVISRKCEPYPPRSGHPVDPDQRGTPDPCGHFAADALSRVSMQRLPTTPEWPMIAAKKRDAANLNFCWPNLAAER